MKSLIIEDKLKVMEEDCMKKVLLFLMIPFLLFIIPVQAKASTSLQEEIIYDILVDRFNNGDPTLSEQVRIDDPLAYQGGDLVGITDKLDRIKKLGFTTITISSILENAPDGYHGYWIEDFYNVEEQFGTINDLKKLIEEAHGRDIKVVMELATNYVAKTHPFVNDSSKETWFKENTVEPIESTTWLNDVAVLDQENEEVAQYLIEVAEFWMDETDLDGFKIHAADQSSPDFLEKLTATIKEKDPDFYLLAHLLTDEHLQQVKDISHFDGIENRHMLEKMNEVFTQIETPISILYDERNDESDERDILLLDNPHTARFSNNFADMGRNAVTTWKLALGYMYTMPGIPMIYQGSELPMYGPGFPYNQELVLFNSTDPELEESFERIAALRNEFPVLQYGDVEQLGSNGAFSLFKRTYEDETMYIAINNDSESRAVSITGIESDKQLRGLLGDNIVRENKNGEFKVGIERESVEVYIIEDNKGFNWWLIGFVVGVFALFVAVIVHLSRKQAKREA